MTRPFIEKLLFPASLLIAGLSLFSMQATEPNRQAFTEPIRGVKMIWVEDPSEPDGGFWRSEEPFSLSGPNIELYCRTLTYRSRGNGFFPEHYAFAYEEGHLVVKANSEPTPVTISKSQPLTPRNPAIPARPTQIQPSPTLSPPAPPAPAAVAVAPASPPQGSSPIQMLPETQPQWETIKPLGEGQVSPEEVPFLQPPGTRPRYKIDQSQWEAGNRKPDTPARIPDPSVTGLSPPPKALPFPQSGEAMPAGQSPPRSEEPGLLKKMWGNLTSKEKKDQKKQSKAWENATKAQNKAAEITSGSRKLPD